MDAETGPARHMTDIAIVSTARTPIGKAYRGALNVTPGAPSPPMPCTMRSRARASEEAEMDDVILAAPCPGGRRV